MYKVGFDVTIVTGITSHIRSLFERIGKMKPLISIAAVVLSSVGAALASPLSPRSPPAITIRHLKEEDVGVRVAAIGNCPVRHPQPGGICGDGSWSCKYVS